MNINQIKNGTELTIELSGRLDTITAPSLEAEIATALEGITDLTFDLKELEYISSAGLRVLLMAQKIMANQGSMKIVNASEEVYEIMDITGFVEVFTIVA